jgi:hypothetical protein
MGSSKRRAPPYSPSGKARRGPLIRSLSLGRALRAIPKFCDAPSSALARCQAEASRRRPRDVTTGRTRWYACPDAPEPVPGLVCLVAGAGSSFGLTTRCRHSRRARDCRRVPSTASPACS